MSNRHPKETAGPRFADLMPDVEPHHHDRVDLSRPSPRGENEDYRRQAATRDTQMVSIGLSDTTPTPVDSEQALLFAAPGVQHTTLRKLSRGQISWQEGIDLHGYRVERARDALDRFIRDAARAQHRCVLVIHGKALNAETPVIKSHVNDWLRQLPDVLAFSSALPREGGTGALYVLLRRHRGAPFTPTVE